MKIFHYDVNGDGDYRSIADHVLYKRNDGQKINSLTVNVRGN